MEDLIIFDDFYEKQIFFNSEYGRKSTGLIDGPSMANKYLTDLIELE